MPTRGKSDRRCYTTSWDTIGNDFKGDAVMTRALVINPSSSIATQSDSPHALGGELHKRRMDLLRELRGIPEIIQAAKELNADEVYKIVSFPDGGQLILR